MNINTKRKIFFITAPLSTILAIILFFSQPSFITLNILIGNIVLFTLVYLDLHKGTFTLKTVNTSILKFYQSYFLITIVIAFISGVFSTFILFSNKELIPIVEVYSALIATTLIVSYYYILKSLNR